MLSMLAAGRYEQIGGSSLTLKSPHQQRAATYLHFVCATVKIALHVFACSTMLHFAIGTCSMEMRVAHAGVQAKFGKQSHLDCPFDAKDCTLPLRMMLERLHNLTLNTCFRLSSPPNLLDLQSTLSKQFSPLALRSLYPTHRKHSHIHNRLLHRSIRVRENNIYHQQFALWLHP